MQKIKNISQILSLIKSKLPEYLQSKNIIINNNNVQCPNFSAHTHNDTQKLSAAFLPNSNKTKIYCFVENKVYDIFDCYKLLEKKSILGLGFYDAVIDLANRFNIPIEYEIAEPQYIEKVKQKKLLENLHKLSLQNIKKGIKYYKLRNLTKEQIKYFKIGFLKPELISQEFEKEFKTLFGYNILSVLTSPSLVIPLYDIYNQYIGLIVRQFESEPKYLNIFISNGLKYKLFGCHKNLTDEVYIVEGCFDAISLYPLDNILALLTNNISSNLLEYFTAQNFKTINLALDGDNFNKPLSSNGIYKCILALKSLNCDLNVVNIPPKYDPDDFVKDYGLEEFKKLPKIPAIEYLIDLLKENKIQLETIYNFISSQPNLIRKEKYLDILCRRLDLKKTIISKEIEKLENRSLDNIDLSQFFKEKSYIENLLVEFEDLAWRGKFKGIPSGYELFDEYLHGLENTLYTFVGYPEMGKTTFLLNIALNLLLKNNDIYIAFYSIDDGIKRSILPRFLSIFTEIPSYKIKNPTEEIKEQWYRGLKKFAKYKNSINLKDGAEIRTIFDLDNYIKIHYNIAQQQNKKLVIILDNIHKISASYKLGTTENSVKVASFLSKIPQIYNCVLITTAEVPKSSHQKPTGKDIKESIDIWYASRCVGGLYTDYYTNSSTNLVHQIEDKMYPIIELYISKNQTGDSWHGSLFYKFFPNKSRLIECSKEEVELLLDGQFI